MAAEGATQALVAAFIFGIVLNAASAALVLCLRGYGLAAVFRDSQRLVLVLFLLSAALWAQVDFITILLDITSSSTPCQIGVIFSAAFDQCARFSVEQFLLWALNDNNPTSKMSLAQMLPQALVLARFPVGAVFIGFTRPQTDNFCVATTSALPVGILTAALDGVIVLLLIMRAYSGGRVAKPDLQAKQTEAGRARALMAVILGLLFWTGTSVPLLLGIRTFDLATRTALPAGGLLVVIVLVTGGAETLLKSRPTGSRPPEAPSPRRINISRDISTSDTDYPPSRYEDIKEAALRSSTTFINPREPPKVKDESSIGLGVGMGSAVRGGAVPITTGPASALARKLEGTAPQKRGLFDSSKGKLAISRPILQTDSPQNPWKKITVVDLKEAAVMDRERRARMEGSEAAAASRFAAQVSSLAPEDAVKRAVSLKRKQVPSASLRESVFPGALHPGDATVASTTSAQLSPGGEETRRRSPRPSLQEEPVRSASPVPSKVSGQERSEVPQNRPMTLQQRLLRSDIRPSRMLPPSPKTPPSEPNKTPLQRRPTIGLPSNPRAQGVKLPEEALLQHRTVLFMNNIEYNDPGVVEAIIKGTGENFAKEIPASDPPETSGSVVNRPRPIPRKPADAAAQSSPALLAHRRSKSGGSLVGRKSLLDSSAGSPTRLPPLPTLPMSAVVPVRPHPNDTKSMTVGEKITLLFPQPPNASAIKRRSSVPELPRIPISYLETSSSPSETVDRQRSSRTTNTSFRTESVLEVDEIPRIPAKAAVNNWGDAAGSIWARFFVPEGESGATSSSRLPAAQEIANRRSYPPIPAAPVRVSAWTETTYDRSEDEGTSWSAVQSPEVAVRVPVMQNLGLPTSIQMRGREDTRASQRSMADTRSRQTLPIVLDTSTVDAADFQVPSPLERETVVTPEPASTWHRRVGDECPTFSDRRKKAGSRKMCPPAPLSLNTTRARKMVAVHAEPSPLDSPGQAIRQIQAQLKRLEDAEQGSPQSASRRLALLEDLEREMGQQAEHWQEIKHDMGRDSMSSVQTSSPSLVANSRPDSMASTATAARDSSLRQSIGAERRASRNARLQNPWEARPADGSVRNSVGPQLSKWQKRLTEAQMDYMDARLLRGSTAHLMQLSRAQLASPTPPDSDNASEDEVPPLPNPFKQVPAERGLGAQANVISVSLWTPAVIKPAGPPGLLWTPTSKPAREPEAPLPGLSVRPAPRMELAPLQIESSQLWRKPYSSNASNRSSSGLWRPTWASAAPPAEPVVRPPAKTASPSAQKPPRPVTQRPPRRNKRVTLLPDILESPEPLPDNRGTLGIFQFPWGEKSDTASIRPRSSVLTAMPGTMASGGPFFGNGIDVAPKQFEMTEYSSSFFDDYEDEDVPGVVDSDEEDSDDAFDETTLWEIASLLNTDAVPSRDSLLPPRSEDYASEEPDSDDEGLSSRDESIVIALAEPRDLLLEQQRDSATIEESVLVMLDESLKSGMAAPRPAPRVGLPANPKASLHAQASRAVTPGAPDAAAEAAGEEMSRMLHHSAEVRGAETTEQQRSASLWRPPSQADWTPSWGGSFGPGSRRSGYRGTSEEPAAIDTRRTPRSFEQKGEDKLTSTQLWAPGDTVNLRGRNWLAALPQGTSQQSSAPVRAGLWVSPCEPAESPARGMFVPGSRRTDYRSTSEEPAAKIISRKPRPAEQKPLDSLMSTRLWSPGDVVKQPEFNWILEASPATRKRGIKNPVRYPRPHFRSEDWKAALDEAIAASYLHVKKPRRAAASSAEWKAALDEAIMLSSRETSSRPAFNPAVRHPVFAARSLASTSEWLHPAATGYTYDVATVHPVFFGSLTITCPEEAVHPAVSSHAVKTLHGQLPQQRSHKGLGPDNIGAREEVNKAETSELLIPGAESSCLPSLPPVDGRQKSRRDTIQAQIEALEQERLFVERAAREEYRRLTAGSTGLYAGLLPAAMSEAVEEAAMLPAGAETVQDLQRHLSRQIRQSLVFAVGSGGAVGGGAAVSRSNSTPSPKSTVASARADNSGSTNEHRHHHHHQQQHQHKHRRHHPQPERESIMPTTTTSLSSIGSKLLWTPPICSLFTSSSSSSPTSTSVSTPTLAPASPGLWRPDATRTARDGGRTAGPGRQVDEEIDAFAAAQSSRRRRTTTGPGPFHGDCGGAVAFDLAGQVGLWSGRNTTSVSGGHGHAGADRREGRSRDWLHSVNMGAKSRGVVLRY